MARLETVLRSLVMLIIVAAASSSQLVATSAYGQVRKEVIQSAKKNAEAAKALLRQESKQPKTGTGKANTNTRSGGGRRK